MQPIIQQEIIPILYRYHLFTVIASKSALTINKNVFRCDGVIIILWFYVCVFSKQIFSFKN